MVESVCIMELCRVNIDAVVQCYSTERSCNVRLQPRLEIHLSLSQNAGDNPVREDDQAAGNSSTEDLGSSRGSVAGSGPLEPGLYIGTRLAGGEREVGTTVVKVSGEAPWLKMEEMKPTGSTIPPNYVKDLVRIDQMIDHNDSECLLRVTYRSNI